MGKILFAIGGKQFSCAVSGFFIPNTLSEVYEQFFFNQKSNSQRPVAETSIHFHRSETEIEDWKRGAEIFRASIWRQLKTDTEYFIVGTTFNPPRLFWIARSDLDFRDIQVWCNGNLVPDRPLPMEVYVEPALRMIARLVLMYDMLRDRSGILLHTAALHIDDRIWLFSGCSGAGKSTFSRLWLERTDAHVVNDDRMIVRKDESGPGFTAYGTPWPGELGIALNASASLGGICFLHKSAQTEIRPITPRQALPQLLPLASIPWYEQELIPPALDFCDRLLAGVPLYELHFRPDQSAIKAVLSLAG